jgi:hypothetical protein
MSERGIRNVCLGIVIAITVTMVWMAYASRERWKAFSTEHHCRKVGEMSPDVSTGIGITPTGQVGQVVTVDAGKNGYLCDDGITYWR